MGIFEIIGPVMIGPSSSHTAGAARIGRLAREILGDAPAAADITLYGSFAETGRGHGTDKAIAAGILGYPPSSDKIRNAFDVAEKQGVPLHFSFSAEDMGHPNVAEVKLIGKNGKRVDVIGRSLGGGRVLITEIDGYPVEVSGEEYTLMTHHRDVPGVVAEVCRILAKNHVNISNMRVFRKSRGDDAVMIIHTDGKITGEVQREIENGHPEILQVMAFDII